MTASTLPSDATRTREKSELADRIRREKRAALIVNTKSRRGQAMYREAKGLLEAKGVTLAAAYPVRDPSRFPELVAQCAHEGNPLIVLGGGDGSISASMDVFANQPVALGLLPLGTANSFARSLGIPLDLPGAVDVAVEGKVVDVDLGRINGCHFANAAAIGLQPAIARAVPHGLKKIAGRIGYLLVAAGIATRLKPFKVAITFADGTHEDFAQALEVRIANGPYKGGMLIAREADVESGDLVIHVVKGRSLATLATVWAQVAAGIAPSLDHIAVMRSARFTVSTEPSLYVSIDGEAATKTPIDVAVSRQALRIMVPHSQTGLS